MDGAKGDKGFKGLQGQRGSQVLVASLDMVSQGQIVLNCWGALAILCLFSGRCRRTGFSGR